MPVQRRHYIKNDSIRILEIQPDAIDLGDWRVVEFRELLNNCKKYEHPGGLFWRTLAGAVF
jgi:hypothetical protein